MGDMKWKIFLPAVVFVFLSFSCSPDNDIKTIELDPAERQWLTEHKDDIYFAPDPFYSPFEYFDEKDGVTKGLANDYLNLIAKKTNLKINVIRADSFGQILDMAKQKKVSIVNAATKTPERSEYLLFTDPIVEIKNIILVGKGGQPNVTLDDLYGKKVSLVRGYAITEYLLINYPDIDYEIVSTDLNAILNVSYNVTDAAVIDLATASYITENEGITNVRVAGDCEFPIRLAIGSRKDWPELSSILNKGLAAITKDEHLELRRKWISIDNKNIYTYWEFRAVLIVLSIILIVLGLTVIWNKQLKRQTIIRTLKYKQAEEIIRLNEARLEGLLRINQHPTDNIQELLDYVLGEAILLTGSKIGYIYFYEESRKEFILNTWSKDVMKICTVTQPQTIYSLDKTGIWGEAVRQRKPIVINDFAVPNPLKKGMPEGHAPLKKFMTIPVFCEGNIVAVVGVANKEDDYKESDIRQLNLMMDAVWKIVQRNKAAESLRESEQKFREIFNATSEAIFIHDSLTGKILDVNNTTLRMYGYDSKDSLIEMNIGDLSSGQSPYSEHEACNLINLVLSEGTKQFEWLARKKSGDIFPVEVALSKTVISGRVCIMAVVRDITERKQAAEKINILLKEKDILLKETHHRIKNNMGVIKTLLLLQMNNQDNNDVRNILSDAAGRVQSMLVLYDKLYRSETHYELDIKEFLPPLISDIISLFHKSSSVEVNVDIDNFVLNARLLSSIGIIINELITNSMKYAFIDDRSGLISVVVHKYDDTVTIIYSDNGIGLPENIDLENNTTFGLQLISMLVKQISGVIDIERGNGSKFIIKFTL